MSTLINLIISFIMGVLLGSQLEAPKTAHHDLKEQSTEIFQDLEARQKILEC